MRNPAHPKRNPIISLLTEQRLAFEVQTIDSADETAKLWWKSFSTRDSPLTWFDRKLYWHCFSSGCKPSLAFDAAVREYNSIAAKGVWLLTVSRRFSVVVEIQKSEISSEVLRRFRENYLLDLYVFDKSASWTFVRTHEEEMASWTVDRTHRPKNALGPYFSRRAWKQTLR